MNNFQKRAITGILFVAILIGGILFHPVTCVIIFGIFTLLGISEFYTLVNKTGITPQKTTGIIGGMVLYICCSLFYFNHASINLLAFVIPVLFFPFIIELYRKSQSPFSNIAFTLLGIFYIALPFSMLIFFSSVKQYDWISEYAPHVLIAYFILLWANDTGAYLFGMKFGKHKLFERISPKKSWEGAVGGGVLSVTAAYFIALNFDVLTLSQWIIVAVIVVVFGNLGDLAESMFKRSIGVKDSGTILPGHGGILDRFDGIFISAPMVCAYLLLIGVK